MAFLTPEAPEFEPYGLDNLSASPEDTPTPDNEEIIDNFTKAQLLDLRTYERAATSFKLAMTGGGLMSGVMLTLSAHTGAIPLLTVVAGGTPVGWILTGSAGSIALLALMVMIAKYTQADPSLRKKMHIGKDIAGGIVAGGIGVGAVVAGAPAGIFATKLIAGAVGSVIASVILSVYIGKEEVLAKDKTKIDDISKEVRSIDVL